MPSVLRDKEDSEGACNDGVKNRRFGHLTRSDPYELTLCADSAGKEGKDRVVLVGEKPTHCCNLIQQRLENWRRHY